MATISSLPRVQTISNSTLFLVTENGVTKVVTWSTIQASLRGFTGSRGPIGFTGFRGSSGVVGSRGFVGSQGPIGPAGPAGGFTGSEGRGPQGITGFRGSNGFTGSRGDRGFAGSGGPGFTGSSGSGVTGSRGFSGSQGFIGSTGFTGSGGPGFTGSSGGGFVGSQGEKGDPGNPGGYTGSSGTLGFIGSKGEPGSPGGFTGSIGFVSSRGFTGSSGSGFTGSGGPGFTGSSGGGFTGSHGGTGATGFTGSGGGGGGGIAFTYSATAPVSPNVGDRWYDSEAGRELVYVNDGTSSQWIETAGSQIGYIGSPGASGSPGGYTGSEGPRGTGGLGYTGSLGFAGSRGLVGSSGVGFAGSAGFTGSSVQGFTGSSGAFAGLGYTGSGGSGGGFTGSQGQSVTGSMGFTGSSGSGATGSFGFAGSRGFVGSSGQGYTGSSGASSALGYTGSAGSGGGGITQINIQDEAIAVSTNTTTLNFVGDGVAAYAGSTAGTVTISISSSGTGTGVVGSLGYAGSRGFSGSQGIIGYTGSGGSGSSGISAITVRDESVGISTSTTILNFVGDGVTAYAGSTAGVVTVSITSGIGYVGSRGTTGFIGSSGSGVTGSFGFAGSRGFVGSSGVGSPGFTGSSGLRGSSWTYNVKDYGAIGNNIADDTTAIQSAISAASAGGGTVFFPAGTYKITAALNITTNNQDPAQRPHLLGEGPGGSVIIQSSSVNGINVTGSATNPNSYVTIQGLSLVGSNAGSGLSFTDSAFTKVSDVQIVNWGTGIYGADFLSSTLERVVIRFNTNGFRFERSSGTFTSNPNAITMIGCIVGNNTTYGGWIIGAGTFNMIGGSVESNASNTTELSSNWGLRITDAGGDNVAESSTGFALHGVYFEANGGRADLWIEATESNTGVVGAITGCSFQRISSAYATNHIRLEATSALTGYPVAIVGCGFRGLSGYTPAVGRPNILNFANYFTVQPIACAYSSDTDAYKIPVPATSTSAGVQGMVTTDDTYMYICVDKNKWFRYGAATF